MAELPPDQAAPSGVNFPAGSDGRRSSSAVGKAVVADALRAMDPAGAEAVEAQKNWRGGYLEAFRRLVVSGLPSRDAALSIASGGLASLHSRMRVQAGGAEMSLAEALAAPAQRPLATVPIKGSGRPERELTLPFKGERLSGESLIRQLDAWVEKGVMEPSAAEAVRKVAAHPEWLDLTGDVVAVLGATSEMGPLRSLLRWGATVAALDLPRPDLWTRVLEAADASGGTLLVPVAAADVPGPERPGSAVAPVAGADLLQDLPAVAGWLSGLDGRLTIGNYVYADGATNLRLSVAVDALSADVVAKRADSALAFLATPTDVFAVPPEVVEQSNARFGASKAAAKVARRSLRTVSGGRLLRPAYSRSSARPDGIGIADSLVSQQGPNYALAKRLQRWRAAAARDAGTAVSLNVAPPTRTRSVVKNRALAAAYAGAHRFGVEVFDPATSSTLMAALLVHDLRAAPPAQPAPWQDEAYCAVHGGLWRGAYDPRSALGLAALLGIAGART